MSPRLLLLLAAPLIAGLRPLAAQDIPNPVPLTGEFWSVIDSARPGPEGCAAITGRLEEHLRSLSDSALEEFANEWADWWDLSLNRELWGADYIIERGISDDSFDYFRGWLLTEGSERWRRVSREPDTAFDDIAPGSKVECANILGSLPTVYGKRFGKAPPTRPDHGPYGGFYIGDDLARRFPRLMHRFAPDLAPPPPATAPPTKRIKVSRRGRLQRDYWRG